jgi:hypothetical protein
VRRAVYRAIRSSGQGKGHACASADMALHVSSASASPARHEPRCPGGRSPGRASGLGDSSSLLACIMLKGTVIGNLIRSYRC